MIDRSFFLFLFGYLANLRRTCSPGHDEIVLCKMIRNPIKMQSKLHHDMITTKAQRIYAIKYPSRFYSMQKFCTTCIQNT